MIFRVLAAVLLLSAPSYAASIQWPGGHTIQDEGGALPARPAINFTGSAVACTDNTGGSTDCAINTAGVTPVDIYVNGGGYHADLNNAWGTQVDIVSISIANPTVITTAVAHGMSTGDNVRISRSNSAPLVDGTHKVTVIDATSFTVPVNVTASGNTGASVLTPWDATDAILGGTSLQLDGVDDEIRIPIGAFTENSGFISMWLGGGANPPNQAEIFRTHHSAGVGSELRVYTSQSITVEDLTTYTETDPNARITVNASTVTSTGLTRADIAWVSKSFGANPNADFSGDFEVRADSNVLSCTNGGFQNLVALANSQHERFWFVSNSSDLIGVRQSCDATTGVLSYVLEEIDGGTVTTVATTAGLTKGTTYYLTWRRDEAIGAFGTVYLDVYSNSARTSLVETVSLALSTSKKDFQYLYVTQAHGASGQTQSMNSTISNFIVNPVASPSIIKVSYGGVSDLSCTSPNWSVNNWLGIRWSFSTPTLTVECYTNTTATPTDSGTRSGIIPRPDVSMFIGQGMAITLDDLRFYSTALNSTDRATIYNAGTGSPCIGSESGILACYPFEQFDGILVEDKSVPAGLDTNDCVTSSTPCKTMAAALNKAAKNFSAGQDVTLHVASGIYTEQVLISHFAPWGDFDLNIVGTINADKGQFTNIPLVSGTSSGSNTAGWPNDVGSLFNDTTSSPFLAVYDYDRLMLEVTGGVGFCTGTDPGPGLGNWGNWHNVQSRVSDSQIKIVTRWTCSNNNLDSGNQTLPDATTNYALYDTRNMSTFDGGLHTPVLAANPSSGRTESPFANQIDMNASNGVNLIGIRSSHAYYRGFYIRASSPNGVVRCVSDTSQTQGFAFEYGAKAQYIAKNLSVDDGFKSFRILGTSTAFEWVFNKSVRSGDSSFTVWRTSNVGHLMGNYSRDAGAVAFQLNVSSSVFNFGFNRAENALSNSLLATGSSYLSFNRRNILDSGGVGSGVSISKTTTVNGNTNSPDVAADIQVRNSTGTGLTVSLNAVCLGCLGWTFTGNANNTVGINTGGQVN